MSGPYPYVGEHTAKDVRIEVYGDIERKDKPNDIWQICAVKVSVWEQAFWCRGYYVDTVGRNKAAIAKYIQQQLEEEQIAGQISMKEYIDPFTGKPEKEDK